MRTTRNIVALLLTCSALLTTSPSTASTGTGREVRINTENFDKLSAQEQQRVLEIKGRLEVILATDRSTLDRAQRDAMRTEWKNLRSEMRDNGWHGSVIYISTAGLIIIILLLILIL